MEMISGSLLRKSCAKYVTNISFRFANKLERSYYAKTLLGVYNCTEKYKFCYNCRYLCHAQMVQDKCAKFFKIPIKLPSGFTVYKIYKMETTSGVNRVNY